MQQIEKLEQEATELFLSYIKLHEQLNRYGQLNNRQVFTSDINIFYAFQIYERKAKAQMKACSQRIAEIEVEIRQAQK